MVVREAPAYGIVGQDVQIAYRISDPDAGRGALLPLTIHQDNIVCRRRSPCRPIPIRR